MKLCETTDVPRPQNGAYVFRLCATLNMRAKALVVEEESGRVKHEEE